MQCKIGDWVQIHQIILNPEDRAPQVPEDTKKVPLELWVKGYALHKAKIGKMLEIETLTGRRISGKLVAIHPRYFHDFGSFVPELHSVGKQLRNILSGGEPR